MRITVIDGETTSTAPEGGTAEAVAEPVADVAEAVAEAVAKPNPEPTAIVDVDMIAEAVTKQLTEAAELEKEQNEFKAWQDGVNFKLDMLQNDLYSIITKVQDILNKLTVEVPADEIDNNPVATVEVIPEPVIKTEESEPVATKSRKWF